MLVSAVESKKRLDRVLKKSIQIQKRDLEILLWINEMGPMDAVLIGLRLSGPTKVDGNDAHKSHLSGRVSRV